MTDQMSDFPVNFTKELAEEQVETKLNEAEAELDQMLETAVSVAHYSEEDKTAWADRARHAKAAGKAYHLARSLSATASDASSVPSLRGFASEAQNTVSAQEELAGTELADARAANDRLPLDLRYGGPITEQSIACLEKLTLPITTAKTVKNVHKLLSFSRQDLESTFQNRDDTCEPEEIFRMQDELAQMSHMLNTLYTKGIACEALRRTQRSWREARTELDTRFADKVSCSDREWNDFISRRDTCARSVEKDYPGYNPGSNAGGIDVVQKLAEIDLISARGFNAMLPPGLRSDGQITEENASIVAGFRWPTLTEEFLQDTHNDISRELDALHATGGRDPETQHRDLTLRYMMDTLDDVTYHILTHPNTFRAGSSSA